MKERNIIIPILQISKKKHKETDAPLRGNRTLFGSREPDLQASHSGQ